MNETKKKMTPRQRCAIVFPVTDSGALPHTRHIRRNGNIDSILTFDVAEVESLEEATPEILARSAMGWFGVWHARVSMYPIRELRAWNKPSIDRAQVTLMRLVNGVGIEHDLEVHNGADLRSIHVYKWATPDELVAANEKSQFLPLEKMRMS